MPSVHLKWKEINDNEKGHRIYRALVPMDTAGVMPTPIATLGPNVTEYYDNTVVEGRDYFYVVSAFNDSFENFSANMKVEARMYPPEGLLFSAFANEAGRLSPSNTASAHFYTDFLPGNEFIGTVNPLHLKLPVVAEQLNVMQQVSRLQLGLAYTVGFIGYIAAGGLAGANENILKIHLLDSNGVDVYALNFIKTGANVYNKGSKLECVIDTGLNTVRFTSHDIYEGAMKYGYGEVYDGIYNVVYSAFFTVSEDGITFNSSNGASTFIPLNMEGVSRIGVSIPTNLTLSKTSYLLRHTGYFLAINGLKDINPQGYMSYDSLIG